MTGGVIDSPAGAPTTPALDAAKAYDRPAALAAMTMMTNLGALTMLLTPAVIAAFVGAGRFSPGQASTLTAVELGGMTLAVLASSLQIARIDRRLWISAGWLVAVAGQLASIYAQSFALLLALRAVTGLGVGVAYTIAVAGLAATRSPDRSFGLAITANQLSATLVLAVASGVGLNHGHGRVIAILFIFTLLMGVGLPWIPRRGPALDAPSAPVARSPSSLAPALLGLAGMFLFLVGVGSVWPIVGPIAQSHGVHADAVGAALAVAGVGGITAGLLVFGLGTRLGRFGPLMAGTLGLAGAMLLLLIVHDGRLLMVDSLLIMFFWIFSIPYLLGALSSLDQTGRLTVISSAMMPFGLAAGQALAAAMNGASNSTPTIALSASLLVGALVAMGGATGAVPVLRRLHLRDWRQGDGRRRHRQDAK